MMHPWRFAGCLVLLGLATAFAACGPADRPATPAPTGPPAWRVRGEEMVTRVKPGMTQDEVLKVLGQPSEQHTWVQGPDTTIVWQYDLTNCVFVGVVFDANGKLLTAKVTTRVPSQ